MGTCLLITLPLEVVIGARVYRSPRRLLRALAAPVALFTVWDVVAIDRGHWWFSSRYTTGWTLPGELPVEELSFFVAVPLCSLLTYEAVRRILGDA
jgi:lycopene cyclase domain-containing protein